jgi:hypothetical protein
VAFCSEIFVRISAEAIFAKTILTAVSFRVIHFCSWLGLLWINHHCFRDLVAVPFCHGSKFSFAFWQEQPLQKQFLTAVSFRVIHFLQLAWTAL